MVMHIIMVAMGSFLPLIAVLAGLSYILEDCPSWIVTPAIILVIILVPLAFHWVLNDPPSDRSDEYYLDYGPGGYNYEP